jgi:hypothetical protein
MLYFHEMCEAVVHAAGLMRLPANRPVMYWVDHLEGGSIFHGRMIGNQRLWGARAANDNKRLRLV